MGFELGTPTNTGTGFFPLPVITEVKPSKLNHNEVKVLTISGSYFTEGTSVSVIGLSTSSITFISDNEIQVQVTGNTTDGFYDLIVTNETGTTTVTNGVQVELSVWVDLRLGGDVLTTGNAAGNDVRMRTGMTALRDANGMYFTGATPWITWVKMDFLKYSRGDDKTVQWIFNRNTSFMMIGIGSDDTNETNTAQYAQAEIEAYFNSATNFWGLYGNNGTAGSAANQSDGISTAGGTGFFKIKFEDDGEPGSTFTLYRLPSGNPSDWDDETTVLKTITVASNMTADATDIMPMIVPQNGGTQRFLAVKVE